jgi:heptosyltransferase-2
MSTAFVSQISNLFPLCQIDYLACHHSKNVVKTLDGITKVHYFNHWYFYKKKFFIFNFFKYFIETFKLISSLRCCNYDLAIDLRIWFPNGTFILWLAGIPIRIGFDRLGFSGLQTHSKKFIHKNQHEIEYQAELLDFFSNKDLSSLLKINPLPITKDSHEKVKSLLKNINNYSVFHMTSSTKTRDWNLEGWIEIANYCIKKNIIPVISGQGNHALHLSNRVLEHVPNVISLVNMITWDEFVALIYGSKFVISVETAAGHIASSFNKPTISIYGGMADWRHWKPFGNNVNVVFEDLKCSPCFNAKGCEHLNCLKNLSSLKVKHFIDNILNNH